MNRYLAKLASVDEKRAYPSNPQNPQNPRKLGFEGFEGSLSNAFLPLAIPPTELPGTPESNRAGAEHTTAVEEEARHDSFEERAAILEFDGGLPRADAEAIAHREMAVGDMVRVERDPGPYSSALAALRAKCPAYVFEDRWRQAIVDATMFDTQWGAEAQAFRWTERELFGLRPVPERPAADYSRLARVDDMGLVWLLRGRPVIVLTSTEAIIRCPSGATLKFYKRAEAAPATEIATSYKPAAEPAPTEIAT
jgi:hypothetical protein